MLLFRYIIDAMIVRCSFFNLCREILEHLRNILCTYTYVDVRDFSVKIVVIIEIAISGVVLQHRTETCTFPLLNEETYFSEDTFALFHTFYVFF